ncbi:MAG: aminopeptidase, partial [Ignavibacteria bacterium]
MDPINLKKYTELIINVGVNIYKGQCLVINCGILYHDFALMLAESAYAKGARYVDIQFSSNRLTRSRIENNSDPDDLKFVPNFLLNKSFEILSNDWAYIRIDNLEELDILKGIEISKYSVITKNEQETFKVQANAFGAAKNPWTIVAAPSPVWASRVLNNVPANEAVDELWKKMIPILRLDKNDPAEAWRLHGETLINRSRTLTEMNIDKLLFKGPGTDLEIGLNKTTLWRGGPAKADNGRFFLPNLPTEEVFTTPDYRRTTGRVSVTKPVKVMENLLTGIWFEFKKGKVVDFNSDSGKEILEKYFAIDEGASYLGEVALVDS